MLNEATTAYDKTVMGEISSWKRIEASIEQISGPKVLKDREWLQLRLFEYERIVREFRSTARTRDEKAWLLVADIERKRLEKALYPSLIARMIHKVGVALFERLDVGRRQEQPTDTIFNDSVFQRYKPPTEERQVYQATENAQDIFVKKPVGQDLGCKKEQKTGNGLHM
ncbi:hypothetical protein HGH92_29745 [Chitinophaga varians]|uniref:Uncharacterized protein n=1 Tax=Chitinophaga varians TaxID=2202339 RepID=A0A847S506_9BACT|nr:hypothetical protein [Chitinophaga varians]NLR68525.1 hypothetical protein [Chitinophaga varians]